MDRHLYHNISHSENYVLQFNSFSETSLKQNNKAHLGAKCEGLFGVSAVAFNPATTFEKEKKKLFSLLILTMESSRESCSESLSARMADQPLIT